MMVKCDFVEKYNLSPDSLYALCSTCAERSRGMRYALCLTYPCLLLTD